MDSSSNKSLNGFCLDSLLENNLNLLKFTTVKDDKTKLVDSWLGSGAQNAFLGPNLWDDADDKNFRLELFDLDGLLNDDTDDIVSSAATTSSAGESAAAAASCSDPLMPSAKRRRSYVTDVAQPGSSSVYFNPELIEKKEAGDAGEDDEEEEEETTLEVPYLVPSAELALASPPGVSFDPKKRHFSREELRPQPVSKKSRKKTVQLENKDDKYWVRREKNNVAAKRSRDAKRVKENQVMLRADFLESETSVLKKMVEELRRENKALKARLSGCRC